MQDDPGLAEILRARPAAYNRQADELERRSAEYDSGAQMLQVAVLEQTRLVGRLGTNGERITEALRVWAKAMAWTILGGPIDLCWQPVVYRGPPLRVRAMEPTRPPAARRRGSSAPVVEVSR